MMSPARYLALLGGFLGAMAVVWAAVVVPLAPPSAEARWVHDLILAKHAAARGADGPRLLVVGGSGTHFGIDTKLIEGATGLPSFNLGAHGDLGLVYLLDVARRIARRGDVVVIAIEYHLMDFDTKPPQLLREHVRSFDRDYLGRAPLHHLPLFLFWMSPESVLRNTLQARAGTGHMVLGKFELAATNIDRRGNETINRADLVDGVLRQRVAADSRLDAAARPNPLAIEAMSAFVAWCQANGIRIVATWANMYDDPRYREAAFTRYFARHDAALRSIGVPVVGTPRDALVDLDGMFDTMYHPNDRGRETRTRRLVALLCADGFDCIAGRASEATRRGTP